MLLDDYDYVSYLEPSKALAFVNDCPVSEQSFELGMYAERNYTRAGLEQRAFGGLTLNYNFGGDLNAIYLTKLGRYSDENYEMIRDFGYDAQIDMDGNDYCVSIEFDTTLFYIVSGSKHVDYIKRELRTEHGAVVRYMDQVNIERSLTGVNDSLSRIAFMVGCGYCLVLPPI
ncbi:unnamed protein product [Anisakis simplex]|uniref:TonB_dep_Rec domain-containing protein n=1 Tax=Anisakis simplex TaxID=6269 RepID=A0A0M3JWB5_ANISI|nr:unnamed protein product [Anisakis simplex]